MTGAVGGHGRDDAPAPAVSEQDWGSVLISQIRDYAILALDPRGVVQAWYPGAQQVKGYAADEIVERHFSVFYTVEDRRSGLPGRLLEQARTLGRIEHTGWRVRKDGSRFWGDVIITALHDDGGELVGYGKVTRDLTERKLLESARESFFATVSHDLKTPVTALMGFAELIGSVDEHRRDEVADRIVANARRLSILVDDLVDYARLRTGGVRLNRGPVSLSDLVAGAVENLSPLLRQHEVLVSDAPVVVDADAHILERILSNLLSNAAKYSPEGSTISVSVGRVGGRGRLVVADEGRGIRAEDLPVIFDEFERGSLAESEGGTGLGLSSVKQLVALHGGEVSICSEVGHGTAVTVELPIHAPLPPGQEQWHPEPADRRPAPRG